MSASVAYVLSKTTSNGLLVGSTGSAMMARKAGTGWFKINGSSPQTPLAYKFVASTESVKAGTDWVVSLVPSLNGARVIS